MPLKSPYKQAIIDVKQQNPTYSNCKIAKILGCNESTVRRYLNDTVRQRDDRRHHLARVKLREDPLFRKWENFTAKNTTGGTLVTLQEFRELAKNHPYDWWTGKLLDLTNSRSYQGGHIIPRDRAGDNSKENCGIMSTISNMIQLNQLVVECLDNMMAMIAYRGTLEAKTDAALYDRLLAFGIDLIEKLLQIKS